MAATEFAQSAPPGESDYDRQVREWNNSDLAPECFGCGERFAKGDRVTYWMGAGVRPYLTLHPFCAIELASALIADSWPYTKLAPRERLMRRKR
jgi:hypothetical protein